MCRMRGRRLEGGDKPMPSPSSEPDLTDLLDAAAAAGDSHPYASGLMVRAAELIRGSRAAGFNVSRKYSLAEIEEMRRDVDRLGWPLNSREHERWTAVEERLRTYMLNGTDPQELHEAADAAVSRKMQEYLERRRDVAAKRPSLDFPYAGGIGGGI